MSTTSRTFSKFLRPFVNAPARRLHSSGNRSAETAGSVTTFGMRVHQPGIIFAPRASSSSGGVSTLHADSGKLGTKLYHSVNLVILAGIPAAVATSPSALTMPLDVVMGLALPLHGHIGMNYVISDYVPKAYRGPVRALTLAASLIAAAGLLKLNFSGPGLTETLKATWRAPQKKNKDKEKAGSSKDAQTTSKTSAG